MNLLWKMISARGGRVTALSVLLGVVSAAGFQGGTLAAEAQVRLRGHVPHAAVAQAQVMSRVVGSEKISLALALPLRDPAGLDTLLSRLYDPHDPLYRHYVTSDEFTRRFGPTAQSYQAVMAYVRARGLTVRTTHPNRLLLDVTGPASTVESAFGLHLLRYRAVDGHFFRAPDAEPLITSTISANISGIIGLSNAAVPRPFSHRLSPSHRLPVPPTALPGDSFLLGTGVQPHLISALQPNEVGSGPNQGLSPTDIRTAYGLSNVLQSGAGRTLALYELDGYTPNDITAYEDYFSLPHVPLLNILVGQSDGSAGGGAGEVTLDIELMAALAPDVSKIIVYEGRNGTSDQVDTYNRIATDNIAKEISTSWGLGEIFNPTDVAAENNIFKQMAAQGQSIYAAAGDSGAYDDGTNLGVDDPASQPFMVGVGGTFLNVTGPGGFYVSESAWGDPRGAGPRNPHGSGGGGGISSVWPIPDYQSGVSGVASTTQRNVPDVSLDADPNTGYAIYFEGGWNIYGGTSCAAPLWAAFTALVNQQRATNLEADLGFANPLLYQIAGTADYAAAFHDVNDGTTNLFYATKPGYDNATGLGTFNGARLLSLLAPPAASVGRSVVSLVFVPNPAYAGHIVTATVTINSAAASGGLVVKLSANDPVTLPIQATVTVPAGATTATFVVTPSSVTASKIVTVTATTSVGSKQANLTVQLVPDKVTPAELHLDAVSVYGGTATTGTITLNGPAPGGGLTVTLTRSSPVVVIPSSITIPGNAVSATFSVGTQNVLNDVPVTLTAMANDVIVHATLIVTAPAVGPIVLAPSTVTGGTSSTGTLTLNGPAPVGGLPVALSSDNPIATVSPASLVIPEGSLTATFTVTTTVVSSLITANINAVYNGVTRTAPLTVQAGGLAGLSVAPAGVISGGAVVGTVTLDSPAAAGGAMITLTSSNAAATVPDSVLVPPGTLTATFPVTTSAVAAPVTAVISGSLNGLVQTASLAVTPIRVRTLSLSPTTAAVGGAVTGTITLTVPALTGGVSVALSSSSAAATVPPTVVVPQGSTTATFPVTPMLGGGVTISATAGGKTQTVGLTVLNAPGTTFPAGLNLLSVPYDYSGQPLDTLFGFSGVKLAVWQPLLSQYAVTPNAPADALRPGVGYWIKLPTAVTLTRAGVPTNRTTDFNITLSPGWNQIGDPFPVSIKRSSLQISQGGTVTTFLQAATGTTPLVSDLIYSYSPGVGAATGSYVSVADSDSLQPGLGYWLYSYQAVTLIIPHTGG